MVLRLQFSLTTNERKNVKHLIILLALTACAAKPYDSGCSCFDDVPQTCSPEEIKAHDNWLKTVSIVTPCSQAQINSINCTTDSDCTTQAQAVANKYKCTIPDDGIIGAIFPEIK